MVEYKGDKKVWMIQEVICNNRKNCRYLRMNCCCVHDKNPADGTVDSCRIYLCPIRLVK